MEDKKCKIKKNTSVAGTTDVIEKTIQVPQDFVPQVFQEKVRQGIPKYQ